MSELSNYSLKDLKELRAGIKAANANNPTWIRDREVAYIDKEINNR